MLPMRKQSVKRLTVTSFADPTEARLAAGGALPRHQPEPGSKLPAAAEHARIRNGRCNRGCDNRPDPRDGGQTLADRVVLVPSKNLCLQRSELASLPSS
jgi:hypothetical protein